MEILQVVGLGLVATALLVVLRQLRPELAIQLSLTAGVVIFLLLVGRILSIIEFFRDLAVRANLELIYVNTVLKIIGIAYITEFGSQVCRDANEGAVASKIEMAGKILILLLAIPIILAILEAIMRLLP